jgi:hypothetical protein
VKFKNIQFTEDTIFKLLEALGFTNITNHEKEFKFSWYDGASLNGSCLFKDTLVFKYWSKGLDGDIIELVRHKLQCGYREAFKFIEEFSNQKLIYQREMTSSIFQSYLDMLRQGQNEDHYEVYDERILLDYKKTISQLFLKDGVSTLIQYRYGLIYDEETSRIGIPIRDYDGNLVGLLGRFNYKKVNNNIPKYLPIINYKRSLFLFGLGENKKFMQDKIYIVESEKSVLQANSMGFFNVVALGTCNISKQQKKLLEQVNPDEVILLLDEGLPDDMYEKIAKRLISLNPIVKYKIKYINANDCNLGSKNCIFDESIDKVNYILNNKLIEVMGV